MEKKDYRLSAIMYTDISGFSRMMGKDESGTLDLLAWHNELVASAVAERNGTVIKTIGDAHLVDFKNTVDALRAAIEIQDRIFRRNREAGGEPLLVRIGIHVGDIHFFENDALGEGINIAARLQALARPGCICISQDVFSLVGNKLDFVARPLGVVPLKNISKEITAYEVESGNVAFAPVATPAAGPASAPGLAPAPGPGPAPRTPPAPGLAPAPGPARPERSGQPAGPATDAPGYASPVPPDDIRRMILADIRAEGRRLSVQEARERYGRHGVEAAEVIASLADSGILVRGRPGPDGEPEAGEPGAGPAYAPAGGMRTDIGRSIENAVHGIVSEIERSVGERIEQSGRASSTEGVSAGSARRAIREARMELRRERRAGRGEDDGDAEIGFDGEDIKRIIRAGRDGWMGSRAPAPKKPRESAFAAYRRKLAAKAESSGKGLVGHIITFIAVNAGLWFLNLGTSPSFLWAAIVSASWGIGLVGNIVDARRTALQAEEAAALPDLDDAALAEYKRINKEREGFSGHAVSAVTVPLLLAVINLMTSPDFLWFLIPSAALAFSFVVHLASWLASFPARKARFFRALGIKGDRRSLRSSKMEREAVSDDLGPWLDLYAAAEAAKRDLESALADMPDQSDMELKPSLDRYLGQIRLLAQSANEIDRIIDAMPMDALSRDKAGLQAKLASAPEGLKAEYSSGIAEIEKQEKAYRELLDQKEVIGLRMRSSVNQLTQMRLDLARIRAAGAEGGPMPGESALARIREKADELGHYLEDMRAGYGELAVDPFEKLEAEQREAMKVEARESARAEPGAGVSAPRGPDD